MAHKTAIISQNVEIGENVEIGPYSIIHEGVVLGDNVVIGAYCEVGVPTPLSKSKKLKIGNSSFIRSHSVLYIGSEIGSNFVTGHHICVRENSVIGKGVQIGSRGDIQGDCEIGDYVKMHADVHIGKMSKIGSFVWMFPEVLLTNDPIPPSELLKGVVVEDFSVLAAKVTVLPGIHIGKDAFISVGSIVKNDVPSGKLVDGYPAKVICDVNIIRMPDNPKIKAYPWRKRFARGYPENIVSKWVEEFDLK